MLTDQKLAEIEVRAAGGSLYADVVLLLAEIRQLRGDCHTVHSAYDMLLKVLDDSLSKRQSLQEENEMLRGEIEIKMKTNRLVRSWWVDEGNLYLSAICPCGVDVVVQLGNESDYLVPQEEIADTVYALCERCGQPIRVEIWMKQIDSDLVG